VNKYTFNCGEPSFMVRDSIKADAFDVSAIGELITVSFFRHIGDEMVKHPELGHEVEARRMEKFSEYQVTDGWYVELDRSDILNEAESILKGAAT
jgi:hypothetical protein